MNRLRIATLVSIGIIVALLLAGCGGGGGSITPTTYSVSGQVVDTEGVGIQGVTIAYTGGAGGTVTSKADGTWTITGLKGSVKITPQKDGWSFSAPDKNAAGAQQGVLFTGFPHRDYMGLSIGTIWEYRITISGDEPEDTGVFEATVEVIEVLDHPKMPEAIAYKIKSEADFGVPESEYASGVFQGRIDNTYYDFGVWTENPDLAHYPEQWDDEPWEIPSAPIQAGDSAFELGGATRERVEVAAGEFDAWAFRYSGPFVIQGGGYSVVWRQECTLWFVPYLGMVKNHVVNWDTDDDGNKTSKIIERVEELVSYTIP